jgi:hypothetical protein
MATPFSEASRGKGTETGNKKLLRIATSAERKVQRQGTKS